MLYNKTQFKKVNDKKVLHKVKKQWVVMSLSMLALLGGGVAAEHVSAHADTTNNQGQPTLKDRLNQSLSQAHKATLVHSPAEAQSVQNNTYNGRQLKHNNSQSSSLQSITDQADVLHNRILNNAALASGQQRSFNDLNSSNSAQKSNQQSNDSSSKVVNSPVVSNSLIGNEPENGEDGDPSFPFLPRSDKYGHKVINLHSHGVYYKYIIQGHSGDVVHLPGSNQYVKFGSSNDSTGQTQLLDNNNNQYDIPDSINGLQNNFYTFSDENFNPEYISYRVTPNLKFYSGRNDQPMSDNIQNQLQGKRHSITVNGYVGEPYIIYSNGDLIGQFNGYRRPISTDHNIPNDNPLYAVINADQDNSNPDTWLNGRDTISLISQPSASPITFHYSTSDGVQASDTERSTYVDDVLTTNQIKNAFNKLTFSSGPYTGQKISNYFQLPANLNNYNYQVVWQNIGMHLQGKNAPAAQIPITFDEYSADGSYERSYSGKTNVGHNYGTTNLTYKISPSDTIVDGNAINPFDTSKYSISTSQPTAFMYRTVNGNQYQWNWDKSKSQSFQIDNNGLHIKMYDTHYDSDGGLYINAPQMYFGIKAYQIKNLNDIKNYNVPSDNFNVTDPNDKKAWPDVHDAQLVHESYDSNHVSPKLPVGTIGSISPENENWATIKAAGPGVHQIFYEYTSNGPKWLQTFPVPVHYGQEDTLSLPKIRFTNGQYPAYPYINAQNPITNATPYQFNNYNLRGQIIYDNWTKTNNFYPHGLYTLQTYNSDGQTGPLLKYDLSDHQWEYPTTSNGSNYQPVNPVPVNNPQKYANGDSTEYFNAYSPAQPMTIHLMLTGTNHQIEQKTIYSNIDDVVEYNPQTQKIITAPSPYAGISYPMSPTQDVMNIPKYYIYDNKQSNQGNNGGNYIIWTLGNNSGLKQGKNCTVYLKNDPRYTHLNWDGHHAIIGKNSPGILRANLVDKQGHMVHYMQFNSNKDYESPQGPDTTTYMPNESMLTGPDVSDEKQALAHNYDDLRPSSFDSAYHYSDLQSKTPVLSENGKVATWTYTEPALGQINIHYIASDGKENHPETSLYAYASTGEDIADAVNSDQEPIFNYSHQAPVYVLLDTTNPSSTRYDEDELFNDPGEVDFDNSKYHDIYIYFTTAKITTHLQANLNFENYDGSQTSPKTPQFSGSNEQAIYNAENILASGMDKTEANGRYRFYADLPTMPRQLTSDGGTVFDLTKSQNLIGNYDSSDDKTDGTNRWVSALPTYTYKAQQGQAVVKLHDVSHQRPDEIDDVEIPLNAGSHQNLGYQELSDELVETSSYNLVKTPSDKLSVKTPSDQSFDISSDKFKTPSDKSLVKTPSDRLLLEKPSNLVLPDGYQIATQPATHDNIDQHLSEYKVQNGSNDGKNATVLDIAPVESWPINVRVEDANGNIVSPDKYDDTSILNAASSRPINYINDSYSDYHYSGQNNFYNLGQVTLPPEITGFDGTRYYLQGHTADNQISPYDYNNHKWQVYNNTHSWVDTDEPTYTYKARINGAITFHYVDESEDNQDIIGADHVMYKSSGNSYDPSKEIDDLENKGYVLDKSHHNPSDYIGNSFNNLSYNGEDQNFYIYLKHGIANDQHKYSYTENIQFVAGQGVSKVSLPSPSDINLKTTFETGVKVDKVTGQIISRDNSLVSGNGEWGSVTIPQIPGCTWSESGTYNNSGHSASSVPAAFPNHNINETITYNGFTQNMNIEYINALNKSQRKSGSTFTYTGSYNQDAMSASDFDQQSEGMPAHFYIPSDYNDNYSDNNGTIDVYVEPYIKEIPVELFNNGSQVYGPGTINITSGGPYEQQQQVGSDIYNYISNIYLPSKGSNYQLTSSDYNALSDYQAGIDISEAGISGISGGQRLGKGKLNAADDSAYSTVAPIKLNISSNQDTIQFENELKGQHPLWTWTSDNTSYWNRGSVNIRGDIRSEVQNANVPNGYYIDPNNNNYKVSDGLVKVNVLPDQVQVPVKYENVDNNDKILHTSSNSNQDYVSYVDFPTRNMDLSGANNKSELVANEAFNKYLCNSDNFSSHQSYATYPADRYQFSVYQNGDYKVNPNSDGLVNNTQQGYTLIPVVPQHIVAEGNWDLNVSGSAKFTIKSDGSGNPHDDTLTFYGGPLDTNSWNYAGYDHGQGKVYVFDKGGSFSTSDNGSDTMPNALNRDSIKYVVFANDKTQLPQGSDNDNGLFKDMHNLTSVQFNGNVNASGAKNLASMFSDDTSLKSLNLGNMDVSKVKDMSNMFAGDSDLSSLTLSTVKTSDLQDISGMFASDSNLKGTTFQDKDVDNNNSQGIDSIKNLSNIKTDNVSDMSDVFESDTGLTNLDLSSWNTDNVSDMDAMFANDPKLQHLNIQNMKTNNVYPGSSDQMFHGDFCASDDSYSDNSDATPKQKDYAIVMNKAMRLTSDSNLIGYWASPDYANDPVMFSPRELDQYGANLGHNDSATWIKWANKQTDLEAEDFQYYNQAGDKVGSYKVYEHKGKLYAPDITSNSDSSDTQSNLYKAISNDLKSDLPSSGYRSTFRKSDSGQNFIDSDLTGKIPEDPKTIHNDPFNFQKGSHRINVLGKSDTQVMPVKVTESPRYVNETKNILVQGYYGDHSDTVSDDQWYPNDSDTKGPDKGYKLDPNSTKYDYNDQLVFNLQNQGKYAQNNGQYTPNKNAQWQWYPKNQQGKSYAQILTPSDHLKDVSYYVPYLDYQSQQGYLDIVYRDPDGSDVGSYQLSNQSDYIDNTVPIPNMTDSDISNTHGGHNAYSYGLSKDYLVNPGQYKYGYRINSEHPIVNVYVYNKTALRVVYVNQSGKRVGDSDTINGVSGQTVNVTDPSDGGEPIPQGYMLDGGDTPTSNHHSDSDVHGNDQDTVYKLSPGSKTVYLHLDGDQADQNQAHVKVIALLHDQNGCTKVRVDSDYQLKPKEDNEYSLNDDQMRIGDDFTITPSDPDSDAKLQDIRGYSITPSDSNQQVSLNPNGVSPSTIVFNYDQSKPGYGSITIHYFDSDTHQEVASGVKNGSIGSATKPSDVVPIPQCYHEDDGDDNSYTYSNVPQDVWIPVSGNSVKDTFTVYQILKDGSGNETVRSDHYNVSGKIGDSFHISPYGFDSDGADYSAPHTTSNSDYSADDSDQDANVRFDSDGRLSMSSVAYAYTKRVQAPTIGTFNIKYVNGSQMVDEVSDSGLQGDPFNLDPFYHDLPNTIAQSYQATGDVYMDHDGDNTTYNSNNNQGSFLAQNYYDAQKEYNQEPEFLKFDGGITHTIYIHIKPIE